jgi:macrolide transport system ATP-binding/permease protein
MRELLRRFGYFLHRAKYERDLDEEMAHHLAMIEQDKGLGAGARKKFGNETWFKEASRSMWTFGFLEQLAQDIRYALRAMAVNPLFTATAALSLALGIGANTAIYSFMNAILMRSLPVAHPEQLAIVNWRSPKRPGIVKGINGTTHRYGNGGIESPNFPYSAFNLFRQNRPIFSTLFGYTYAQNFNVIAQGEAETIQGGFVSGDYFTGLGVPPAAGRLIAPDNDRAGASATVVLAYAYWQRRFEGDAGVVGKSILINNQPFTVAGICAPGFFGVDPESNPAFFMPMHAMALVVPQVAAEKVSRFVDDHYYWIEMMGRLQPGVSMAQAETALRGQFSAFAANTAASPNDAELLPELTLEEGGSGIDSLQREYSKPLFVLMTMVGLILAIACANLANLLLARAAYRRREIAVRLSLGAGRWRIIRQMLTESVLLSVTGGALGVIVALAGIRFITWLLANGRPDFTLRAEIDWPVLGFTFALAVAAGMLFGMAPAIQATKVDFTPALKESRTHGSTAPGHRWRPRLGHALIVVQIAVSLLLVTAAGLFVRTLSNLHSIDVGFNRENILMVAINGRQAGYRGAALARFYAGLLEKFRVIPGVRAASASDLPLVSRRVNDNRVTIPGRAPQPGDPFVNLASVDPAFLETMQIPVLLGRGLQEGDVASSAVAVVNQKFATVFFGGDSPVGRQFSLGSMERLFEIVGVAKNAHYNSLQERDQPVVYLLYAQQPGGLGGLYFELRIAGDPFGPVPAVRRIVHDASHAVSITEVTTQAQRIEQTISQERTFAFLGSCFAVLAMLIACVGLYGAMSYAVARRTGEIGIRMALGAQRPKIIWMVLREVLALTAIGLLIGFGASRLTTKFVESFLYEMKANDPLAVAAAIGILLAAAIMAGYAPAWRASRIDPAAALRNE